MMDDAAFKTALDEAAGEPLETVRVEYNELQAGNEEGNYIVTAGDGYCRAFFFIGVKGDERDERAIAHIADVFRDYRAYMAYWTANPESKIDTPGAVFLRHL